MRIPRRIGFRSLTAAAILGLGALTFTAAPAAAHGGWYGHRHHGWHRPYIAPPVYVAPRVYYPPPVYYAPPRYYAPPVYYAPRPHYWHHRHHGHYRGW